jgi:hypothetical protein
MINSVIFWEKIQSEEHCPPPLVGGVRGNVVDLRKSPSPDPSRQGRGEDVPLDGRG